MLMYPWKANAEERRAIRAVAATGEKRKPGSITIEIGLRYPLTGDGTVSENILLVDPTGDIDNTDLHDTRPFSDLDGGVPLSSDGKAIVDFYVYEKAFNDHGYLLTNVQAYVEMIEGKPRLKKITGTGIKDVSGETLWAFMHMPKQRGFGTRAYYLIEDWVKANHAR
jgi:hypothetical protein